MTFSFAFIYCNFSVENAGNEISEPLNLKTFLGEHAPRPPSLQLHLQNLSYAPGNRTVVLWQSLGDLWFYFNISHVSY